MGIYKASRTRDFSIRPHNPAWDLSSHLCPSLTSSLCLSIPPSPSETVLPAICHVMFMGPFAFVSWWPLSQRATHYRCGLMNDVTQTLCWHLCVLGRRTSQIGPVKNENGGYLGELDGGPVRHPATGCSKPSPALPPSHHRLLSSLYPANGNMRPVNGDDVVINPEVVNSALAFHLNIYLHPNRHSEGPSLPSRGHGRCPKGLTYRWWMLPCLILSVKQTRTFACFDV